MFRFAGTLALLFVTAAASAQDPAQVDKPQFRTGDSWTTAVTDGFTKALKDTEGRVVTSVTADEVRISNARGELRQILDAEMAAHFVNNRKFSRPVRALSFPLTAGKTWEHINETV